jgi:hypothetical protein
MTRLLAFGATLLMLGACDTTSGGGQGDANYDAIKTAADACKAQGGELQLKSGYDGRAVSDYACKNVKAK